MTTVSTNTLEPKTTSESDKQRLPLSTRLAMHLGFLTGSALPADITEPPPIRRDILIRNNDLIREIAELEYVAREVHALEPRVVALEQRAPCARTQAFLDACVAYAEYQLDDNQPYSATKELAFEAAAKTYLGK